MRTFILCSFAFTTLSALAAPVAAPPRPLEVHLEPSAELSRLLKEVDVDGDKKITVDDFQKPHKRLARMSFVLTGENGSGFEISGVQYLSNLLQELKRASDLHMSSVRGDRIFENIVARTSRLIREEYWPNLVRRVDVDHLAQVLPDSKLPSFEWRNLYVPAGDDQAFEYFSKAAASGVKVSVHRLPKKIDSDFLRSIVERHGLLTLGLRKGESGELEGVPFVVPGGRFNEMYGWDSYFESLGLIVDGRVDLAKAMVDNFVYQIENYGKILNANRTYYLNRSQPPFLTSMISAVLEQLPKNSETDAWLKRSLSAAILEYKNVWMAPQRVTDIGLNRYFGDKSGVPPEVEEGHFDYILEPAAKRHHMTIAKLVKLYNAGTLTDDGLDDFFANDRAVRESGHDTTYRWHVGGHDRAADFVTVDLNSLLYKYEIDIARLVKTRFKGHFGDETTEAWRDRAKHRRELIVKYLWDAKQKVFFDYNFKEQVRSEYLSATAFYPFWALDPEDASTRILTGADAQDSMRVLLRRLEAPGGLSGTDAASVARVGHRKRARQWDYPFGWAPHQIIAWTALKNYGLNADRTRLIYRWLYTIARNAADYNGTIPEKFDVVKRSHAVFAEYGNVGTGFSYITREGFGWMNASYQLGLKDLPEVRRHSLENLQPPEWVDFGE